jgi:hypothetical protein
MPGTSMTPAAALVTVSLSVADNAANLVSCPSGGVTHTWAEQYNPVRTPGFFQHQQLLCFSNILPSELDVYIGPDDEVKLNIIGLGHH